VEHQVTESAALDAHTMPEPERFFRNLLEMDDAEKDKQYLSFEF